MIPDRAVQDQVIGPLRQRQHEWENNPLPPHVAHDTFINAVYMLTTPGGVPPAPGGVPPAPGGVLAPRAFLELYAPICNNYGEHDFARFQRNLERQGGAVQGAFTFTRLNVEGGRLKVLRELCKAKSLPCYIYYENGQEVDRLEIETTEHDTVLHLLRGWAIDSLNLQFIGEEGWEDDDEEESSYDEEESQDDEEEESKDDDEEESKDDDA